MKYPLRLLTVLSVLAGGFSFVLAQTPAEKTTPWPNGAACAVSLSYDDSVPVHQLHVAPLLTAAHLTEAVLALPEAERSALAREIIASLATDEGQKTAIGKGVRRMEDIIKGQTTGLCENEFRQALR